VKASLLLDWPIYNRRLVRNRSRTHARARTARTRTHARMHARAHARAHTRTPLVRSRSESPL
jgi:hypothetical protein